MKFEQLREMHRYHQLKDTKAIERSTGTLDGGNHLFFGTGRNTQISENSTWGKRKQFADGKGSLAYSLVGWSKEIVS